MGHKGRTITRTLLFLLVLCVSLAKFAQGADIFTVIGKIGDEEILINFFDLVRNGNTVSSHMVIVGPAKGTSVKGKLGVKAINDLARQIFPQIEAKFPGVTMLEIEAGQVRTLSAAANGLPARGLRPRTSIPFRINKDGLIRDLTQLRSMKLTSSPVDAVLLSGWSSMSLSLRKR